MVAERTGLSPHSLRFYEREGLLAEPVSRDRAGRRVYREDDVHWITLCAVLRASGMPIAAVREYTELVRAGKGSEQRRLALLLEQRARIVAQQEELVRNLDLINHKIGVYEDAGVPSPPDDHRSLPSVP